MNKSEAHIRSITKSITWRILATTTTIILVFIFFRRLDIAAIVGGLEILIKLILYFFHERIWTRVSWGMIIAEGEKHGSRTS